MKRFIKLLSLSYPLILIGALMISPFFYYGTIQKKPPQSSKNVAKTSIKVPNLSRPDWCSSTDTALPDAEFSFRVERTEPIDLSQYSKQI